MMEDNLNIDAEEKRQWFAIKTKPRKEFFAKDNFLRQNYIVYLPTVKKIVSHARKKVLKPVPFFAGYLFLHLLPEERNWYTINSTYGTIGAVRFGDFFPPVPDELIYVLKEREGSDGNIIINPSEIVPFKKGEKVIVRKGGVLIEAIFQDMTSEERAVVLIEMLKRIVPVKVPISDIEKF